MSRTKKENDIFNNEDITFDLDKDLDDILKSFNPDENPFDDELPEPDTPLYRVMVQNNIYHTKQRKVYAEYITSNLGCSSMNPIVINEIDDYVHLEYELLEFLLRPSPYRFVDYEVLRQALISENGRAIDKLTVEVSKHPLLSFEEVCSGYEPPKEVLGIEEYYFDITEGYMALSKHME